MNFWVLALIQVQKELLEDNVILLVPDPQVQSIHTSYQTPHTCKGCPAIVRAHGRDRILQVDALEKLSTNQSGKGYAGMDLQNNPGLPRIDLETFA